MCAALLRRCRQWEGCHLGTSLCVHSAGSASVMYKNRNGKQTCGLRAIRLTHCVRANRPHAEIFSTGRLFKYTVRPDLQTAPGLNPLDTALRCCLSFVPMAIDQTNVCAGNSGMRIKYSFRDGDMFCLNVG